MQTKRSTTATEPTATASLEVDTDASTGQAASMALSLRPPNSPQRRQMIELCDVVGALVVVGQE